MMSSRLFFFWLSHTNVSVLKMVERQLTLNNCRAPMERHRLEFYSWKWNLVHDVLRLVPQNIQLHHIDKPVEVLRPSYRWETVTVSSSFTFSDWNPRPPPSKPSEMLLYSTSDCSPNQPTIPRTPPLTPTCTPTLFVRRAARLRCAVFFANEACRRQNCEAPPTLIHPVPRVESAALINSQTMQIGKHCLLDPIFIS